jgi:beta-lactamase superfamily II metal-dependent hydrolase
VAPWLARRVPAPHLLVVLVYYAGWLAVLLSLLPGPQSRQACRRRRCSGEAAQSRWPWRHMGGHGAGVLDCLLPKRTLRVAFLDVGFGDSCIVRFPCGRSMLVDTGGSVTGGGFDVGGRVVSPSLWAIGVRRLDILALTHGDPDHIGGAPSILRDFFSTRDLGGSTGSRPRGAGSLEAAGAKERGGVEERKSRRAAGTGGSAL